MALTKKELETLSREKADKIRRLWDGNGLYAQVSPNGVISFAMKYRFGGEERRVGLGKWPALSLEDARRKVRQLRAALDRKEPLPTDQPKGRTFTEAADEWIKVERKTLSPRTMTQAERYLKACKEEFGDKPVSEIKPSDVLAALRKFEGRGAIESAKRARIYAHKVFSRAIDPDSNQPNPASLERLKDKIARPPMAKHHAAMPAEKIPDFIRKLAASPVHPSIRSALQFVILTSLRTKEVRFMRWSDFSKDSLWLTIPAERMKMKKAHTVFLTLQSRTIIEEIRPFSEGREFVFPGRDPEEPLSDMAMLMCLTRMEPGYTVHGFRASLSTWAHANGYTTDVIDRCLAHVKRDKVTAAYNRYTYDKEAALLWERWAAAVWPANRVDKKPPKKKKR